VRVPLFCDNTTTFKQMKETTSSKSNKHLETKYAWLQYYAHREGIVRLFNVASGNNLSLTCSLRSFPSAEQETHQAVRVTSTSYVIMCSQEQCSSISKQDFEKAWFRVTSYTFRDYLTTVEREEVQPFKCSHHR
jgi:hypothetical protein